MPYIELLATVVGVVALAWAADFISGRRALPAMIIVGLSGAIAGAFLALRVFTISNYDSWIWPLCSVAGAVLAILLHYLFRNKR